MEESSDAGDYSYLQNNEDDTGESNDDGTSKGGRSEETDNEDDMEDSIDDETSKGQRSDDTDVDDRGSDETVDFGDAPMANGLPNGFDHNLQEPIFMEDPFTPISNIYAYSKRFGCIICLHQECQHVVADSKCYNHLRTNHHHLMATVENGARKKLSDAIAEMKVELPPLFTDPTAIWKQPHNPEPFVNVVDGFKCVRCSLLGCYFAALSKKAVCTHVRNVHVLTGQLTDNPRSDIVHCMVQQIRKGVVYQLIDDTQENDVEVDHDQNNANEPVDNEFNNVFGDFLTDGMPWVASPAATRMTLVEFILNMKGIITPEENDVVHWIFDNGNNPLFNKDMCKKVRDVVKQFFITAKLQSKRSDVNWRKAIAIDSTQRSIFTTTQTDHPDNYVQVLTDLIIWLAFNQKLVKKPVMITADNQDEENMADNCVAVVLQHHVTNYEAIPPRWLIGCDDTIKNKYLALWNAINASIQADTIAITNANEARVPYVASRADLFKEMHAFCVSVFARSSFIKTQHDDPDVYDFLSTFIAASGLAPGGNFKSSNSTSRIAGLEYVLCLGYMITKIHCAVPYRTVDQISFLYGTTCFVRHGTAHRALQS
jgi:Orsellinic acid/F9775 biosynthesis cluster protein D